MRLLLWCAALVACCAGQAVVFGPLPFDLPSGSVQGRHQDEPAGGEDGLRVRIGLVGDQLGNLDPVPGSDYPSRTRKQKRPTFLIASTSNNVATTKKQVEGRTAGINKKCYCSDLHACPYNAGYDGSGLLDVRIINLRPTLVNDRLVCKRADQEVCCPPGEGEGVPSACPLPSQPRSCGLRSILPVPGHEKQPAEAAFGAYPWVATVLRSGDAYVSLGVLIEPQWVLTVAHHVKKYTNNYSGLKVRFGEWDASDPYHEPCSHQERYISGIFVHQHYDGGNLRNDIALLRLSEPVDLYSAPHINTACLPYTGQSFNFQRCWVAGFGKDAFGQHGKYSYIQKEVDVPVVPQDTCASLLRRTRLGPRFTLDGSAFLCAGGEVGKDACEGDGGAPLVCENGYGSWTVAGLVSWGVGCAQSNVPGLYTNVASYIGWIQAITDQYGHIQPRDSRTG